MDGPHGFLSEYRADPFAIPLGTNEIASAIAVRLSWEGFRIVMSHDPFPPVIRRGMAFHGALGAPARAAGRGRSGGARKAAALLTFAGI